MTTVEINSFPVLDKINDFNSELEMLFIEHRGKHAQTV